MTDRLYEQLESILSENATEDVLDKLATVIEQADAWVDSYKRPGDSFQAFAVKVIRNASEQLRDEDWQRELNGDDEEAVAL